jgi:hypothetical protein
MIADSVSHNHFSFKDLFGEGNTIENILLIYKLIITGICLSAFIRITTIIKEIKVMEQASLLDILKTKKSFTLIAKFTSNVDLCRLSMLGRGYQNLLKDRYRKEIRLVDEYIVTKV